MVTLEILQDYIYRQYSVYSTLTQTDTFYTAIRYSKTCRSNICEVIGSTDIGL